ncbi:hypothetical protein BH11PLA2_BH11PLA2_34420 [soil metagenome]
MTHRFFARSLFPSEIERCKYCGRFLVDAASLRRKAGPTCYRKNNPAADPRPTPKRISSSEGVSIDVSQLSKT